MRNLSHLSSSVLFAMELLPLQILFESIFLPGFQAQDQAQLCIYAMSPMQHLLFFSPPLSCLEGSMEMWNLSLWRWETRSSSTWPHLHQLKGGEEEGKKEQDSPSCRMDQQESSSTSLEIFES